MRISDWSSDVCSSDLLDRQQQIAESLTLLELVRKAAQAGREIALLPGRTRENLEERHAVDPDRIEPHRVAEARTGANDTPRRVGFPQPVGALILKIAQQDRKSTRLNSSH